jgi:hypothetical protein
LAIHVKIIRYECSFEFTPWHHFYVQVYAPVKKCLPCCEVYSQNMWQVTTEDGYILSLKRIPHGPSNGDNSTDNENTRQPVLLFHGLMVVRTLFKKPCALELHFHAYLNQMCGLDRMAFLGYLVHQNNHLALFW